jgi:hypothetical protein
MRAPVLVWVCELGESRSPRSLAMPKSSSLARTPPGTAESATSITLSG